LLLFREVCVVIAPLRYVKKTDLLQADGRADREIASCDAVITNTLSVHPSSRQISRPEDSIILFALAQVIVWSSPAEAQTPKTGRGAMAASDLESKAKEAFVDDDFELATELYSQAIDAGPATADLYADRAQAHIKLGNYTGTGSAFPPPHPCSLLLLR
jgi:hypothetical protein